MSYCTSFCIGQNIEIQKLVNEVSKVVVPKDFRFYNLVDSSFILDIMHLIPYNPEFEKFTKDNPAFKLSDFSSATNELGQIDWNNYKINGAHLYPYNDVPKFATHLRLTTILSHKISKLELDSLNHFKKYNEIIVPIKKWWSKKRIEKEVEKKWTERDTNTILENKKHFRFSTPIFSSNQRYAIIEIITGGERSITYVFEKVNSNWHCLSPIYGYKY